MRCRDLRTAESALILKKRMQGSMHGRIGSNFWRVMQESMHSRIGLNFKKRGAGIYGQPNRPAYLKKGLQGCTDSRIGLNFQKGVARMYGQPNGVWNWKKGMQESMDGWIGPNFCRVMQESTHSRNQRTAKSGCRDLRRVESAEF